MSRHVRRSYGNLSNLDASSDIRGYSPLYQINYTRELAREWRCFGSSQNQILFWYQGLESTVKMMSRRRTTNVGLVTLCDRTGGILEDMDKRIARCDCDQNIQSAEQVRDDEANGVAGMSR